ncbi:MAG: hypothetical protein COB59_03970 [Rhodospirillaceae bacterium]|nr:MAG: hypothetical protein COB59_03970 [Rhodospirillaceae bacterium]
MESLTYDILALLFVAGLIGGFVDSIAGGGGLISVPALLAAGIPPVAALATNKAQAMFGSFTAMRSYAKKGHVNLGDMKLAIAFTAVGAIFGTFLAQRMPPDLLMQVIPFLLIAAALYFSFGPKIGHVDRHHKMEKTPFYAIFGLFLGFYDGFFGPGTGSFWTLAFVAVLGFNMLKATAHTKVVNFTSNFTSFLFFAFSGHVLWVPAAAMALGQLIGARLGANLAMKHGTNLIRPLLVTVSLIITTKLIYDDPSNIVHAFILDLIQ